VCDRDGFTCPCGSVQRLAVDPADVLGALPLFETVLTQTWNRVASILQIGAYAPVGRPGTALALDPRLLTLRAEPSRVESVLMTRSDGADASWLHLVGPDQRVAHRFRPLGDLDHVVLAEFGQGGAAAGRLLTDLSPLTALGGADQLARLDATVTGQPLPPLGARTVPLDVVAAVLDHVCSIGLPVGVAIHSPGAAQICQGPVQSTSMSGGRLVVTLDQAIVELDLAGVADCLLIRAHAAHGPTSALELRDADGITVATLSQFGLVGHDVHATWEDVAASLPTHSA
jgi:putative hemin transport protein